MSRKALKPGDVCPTCHRVVGPSRPRRVCARCKRTIVRNHKWYFTERGTVEHRNCEDPASYT